MGGIMGSEDQEARNRDQEARSPGLEVSSQDQDALGVCAAGNSDRYL